MQAHGQRAVDARKQALGGVAEKVVGERDVDGAGERGIAERLFPEDLGTRCAGEPEGVLGHPVACGADDEMFHCTNPRFARRSAWRCNPWATSAGRWR